MNALATDPGAYTGILNQMIVPIVAAITAADHKNILADKLSAWLFIIPLLTIFVCIGGALFFNGNCSPPALKRGFARDFLQA